MDELLPVLVSRMANARAAVPQIQAALRNGIAFVPLEEGPSYEGPHALELHTPEWTEPLVLLAEPAGDPVGSEHPLQLSPLAEEHRETLLALLAEAGVAYSEPPPAQASAPEIAITLGEEEMPSIPPDRPSVPPEERPSMLPSALVGRVLGGGKYAIESQLGSGGMGNVYRARHVMLDKVIAVKVLHPSQRHNEDFLAAFHREALAASRLDHPNVVRVLDFGQEPDGLLYITMELLDGHDLRVILDGVPVQPLDRIVDVMSQVCAALSASHDQNIVHRDVKPENIILVPKRDDDGTVRDVVKVLDFGIAEILGKQAPADEPRTVVSGTPDYMAPEQIRGLEVDARADIYACGVILFEMSTGKVPFYTAESPQQIAWMHLGEAPPLPTSLQADVDPRLEAVILKALSKDAADRQPSARALRAELRAVLEAVRRTPAAHAAFDDLHDIPPGVLPSFERDDAIDIGDLLSLGARGKSVPGGIKEQSWILGEQLATALLQDPAATLARIDAIANPATFAHEMAMLERAMVTLTTKGAAVQLAVVVTHLAARAAEGEGRGGEGPDGAGRAELAARALRSIAKPELLLRLSEEALDGAPAEREPARRVLVQLGAAGAHALCSARERASVHGATWPGRPRFVVAMRELAAGPGGPAGVTTGAPNPGLSAATKTLETFLQQADQRDAAFLEDLLRAVPEAFESTTGLRPNEPGSAVNVADRLGTLISSRDLRHEAPSVRRAAASALAAAWGPRANGWLSPLVEEADDGVRIAALAALRKHGGVDRELVRRIGRILSNAVPSGTDAKVAAAAALGDTSGPARTQAVETLANLVQPSGSGFFTKLVTTEVPDDALVILTMARVLLAIGGPEAARTIEARAAKTGGELRRELQGLLANRSATR